MRNSTKRSEPPFRPLSELFPMPLPQPRGGHEQRQGRRPDDHAKASAHCAPAGGRRRFLLRPGGRQGGLVLPHHEELTLKTLRIKQLLVVGLAAAAAATGGSAQGASTSTVCASGCAFTNVATAVAAAKNGDTISIAPGTYAGGFTIDVSVKLTGAGPGRTVISGGGPVITI